MSRAITLALLSTLACASAVRAQEESPSTDEHGAGETEERAPEAPVRDLEDFTAIARESYPRLRAMGHKIEAARAQLDEATWSPFFQFTGTAAVTIAPEAEGSPIFSPDDQLPLSNAWRPVLSVGVEGAIPLYTFGKLDAARTAARAGIRAAEEERRRAELALLHDVRRAYFNLQLALDVLQMISEGEGKLDQAAEQLEQRLEEGDPGVRESDRWRLATAIAEVRARRAQAERLEAGARTALRILTDVDAVRIPECPIERIEHDLRPQDWYVDRALAQRPDLAMLEQGLAAREANVDATRARLFPDLALALRASHSYGPGITDQTNPFIVDQANYTSLGGALVARWSFDFFGNEARLRRAQAELAETEAFAEEARRGVELEVSTTHQAVTEAMAREEAWREGHREARSWFVASAQGYEVGTLEAKELIDAVKTYFQARFQHLEAIRDVNEALSSLERVTGETLRPEDGWEVSCGE